VILRRYLRFLTDPYSEKYLGKLIGNTEIEDALQELDRLTQDEARMASAELLKIAHSVDAKVIGVDDKLVQVNRSSSLTFPLHSEHPDTFTGNQLRDSLRQWLSPPDPSINHNIACKARHQGTARWFFGGSIFNQWKSTGSFFWLHGKRASLWSLTGLYGIF